MQTATLGTIRSSCLNYSFSGSLNKGCSKLIKARTGTVLSYIDRIYNENGGLKVIERLP